MKPKHDVVIAGAGVIGLSSALALLEADALLVRLLAREVRIVREPSIDWDDLIEGYTLRDFELQVR